MRKEVRSESCAIEHALVTRVVTEECTAARMVLTPGFPDKGLTKKNAHDTKRNPRAILAPEKIWQ